MSYYETIIVGAGPAGLQMGYYMEKEERDYLILESNDSAGSFFATHPRHRTLISINKVHNWFPEDEFNMRHDWNSLLTDDYSLLMREYTEELFPSADILKTYLEDYAEKFALKIRYNTKVSFIERAPDNNDFIITDTEGGQYRCASLIMATGPMKPNMPDIEGVELIEGYEDHDLDLERFKGKRVAVLGGGNSGFEVANHISGHASMVHVLTARNLLKHAWQTHFVGDLRAINNNFLDLYQLKSLHAVVGLDIKKVVKQEDGSLCAHFEEHVPHWSVPGTLTGSLYYDIMIRCTGWHYVLPEMFAPDVTPEADEKSKYPVLSPSWETTVPGLYFIGTSMAARDRKAASGFIHGFRYNVRSLFHILEHQNQGVDFSRQEFSLESIDDLNAVADHYVDRFSTTDALFQLYGVLCDVMVLSDGKATFFKELPVEYVLNHEYFKAQENILISTLEFGFDNYSSGTDSLTFIHPNDPGDRSCGAFLHGILRRYSYGEFQEEHHLRGSLIVRYDETADQFSGEITHHKPRNSLLNYLNSLVHITTEKFSMKNFYNNEERGGFEPWPLEKRIKNHGLPICPSTHTMENGEFVPAVEFYE